MGNNEKKQIDKRAAVLAAFFAILFIIAIILYLGQSGLIPGRKTVQPDEIQFAAVYRDGELIEVLEWNGEATEVKTIRAENEQGGYNEIVVDKEGIHIEESNCPDHICERTVWKGEGSLPIICLPNRLVVRTYDDAASHEKTNGNEVSPDAVSY